MEIQAYSGEHLDPTVRICDGISFAGSLSDPDRADRATLSPLTYGTKRVLTSPPTQPKETRMSVTTKDELAKQVAGRTRLDRRSVCPALIQ
jgi:hypothetical protein